MIPYRSTAGMRLSWLCREATLHCSNSSGGVPPEAARVSHEWFGCTVLRWQRFVTHKQPQSEPLTSSCGTQRYRRLINGTKRLRKKPKWKEEPLMVWNQTTNIIILSFANCSRHALFSRRTFQTFGWFTQKVYILLISWFSWCNIFNVGFFSVKSSWC